MILSFTNGKGGTGKSTLGTYTAEYLYRHGAKVLIIDVDPNCSISEIYGFILKDENSKELLTGRDVKPYRKKATDINYIDIIPSDLDLSMLSNITDIQLRRQIQKQGFNNVYDYIIIDPPGAWNAQTRNAVFAADTVIVCGKCSPLDYKATVKYMELLESCGLESEVFVVCNAYNKRRDPDNTLQKYIDMFGDFLVMPPLPEVNSLQRIASNPDYKINKTVQNRFSDFIAAITNKQWEQT